MLCRITEGLQVEKKTLQYSCQGKQNTHTFKVALITCPHAIFLHDKLQLFYLAFHISIVYNPVLVATECSPCDGVQQYTNADHTKCLACKGPLVATFDHLGCGECDPV